MGKTLNVYFIALETSFKILSQWPVTLLSNTLFLWFVEKDYGKRTHLTPHFYS